MGRQSSITQEQIVSFQQRVKEVTGWLRLRDEIAIDYLEKTDKSLSFEERERLIQINPFSGEITIKNES